MLKFSCFPFDIGTGVIKNKGFSCKNTQYYAKASKFQNGENTNLKGWPITGAGHIQIGTKWTVN